MMRNLSKLFLALCLLAVGGGVVAKAQVDTIPAIEANIPFAFAVGDTTLPAGKYEIKTLDDESANVLELRSVNGQPSVVFATEDAQTRSDQAVNKTELVFNKVGNQYFLSQIWVAGSAGGNEVPKSRMEKRLAKGGSQSEKQSVVASLKQSKR